MLATRCNAPTFEIVSWTLSQMSTYIPRNAVGVYVNLRSSREFHRTRAPKRGTRKYRKSKKCLRWINKTFEKYRRITIPTYLDLAFQRAGGSFSHSSSVSLKRSWDEIGDFTADETEDETTDAAMEHVNHLALIGTPATLCKKVCVCGSAQRSFRHPVKSPRHRSCHNYTYRFLRMASVFLHYMSFFSWCSCINFFS